MNNSKPATHSKCVGSHRCHPCKIGLLVVLPALFINTGYAADGWQAVTQQNTAARVVQTSDGNLSQAKAPSADANEGWFNTSSGAAAQTPATGSSDEMLQQADTVRWGQGAQVSGAQPATVLTSTPMLQVFDDKPDTDSPSEQASLAASPSTRATGAGNTINLDLFAGEVQVLGRFSVSRVAVGNGGIVRAEVLESGELLVIATSPGSSSIRLWNTDGTQTDYNVRVSESDPETRVQMQRMVRMRVRMVEFRKSALGELGIDWSNSADGPGLATLAGASTNNSFNPSISGFDGVTNSLNSAAAYVGIASSITSSINFLAQNGDAVTLAEPVLSAMNGGEASFLAGGEIPYPAVGENGQTTVEFKSYGIKLNVAPLIDGFGNVRANVATEISQVDSSVTVDGAPGLLTRRAQTEVTVQSGQTIVISGLLSSETSTDTDEVPGLGRLPFLGRLFRSESKRNTVSELVIFVTPEVVEPDQPLIDAREQQYLQRSDTALQTVRQQLNLME